LADSNPFRQFKKEQKSSLPPSMDVKRIKYNTDLEAQGSPEEQ
jgi:hypothetical protein